MSEASLTSSAELASGDQMDLAPLLDTLGSTLTQVAFERASERLSTLVRAHHNARQSKTLFQRYIDAEIARMHPFVYDYLRHHLCTRPVHVGGRPISMMSHDLAGRRLEIPVAVIGKRPVELRRPVSTEVEVAEDWEANEFVRIRRQLGGLVIDNEVFSAKRLYLSADCIEIEGALTRYGTILATQDALEWELLSAAGRHLRRQGERARPEDLTEQLIGRLRVEASSTNYLLEGAGRGNGLSVATVIIYNEADEFRVMIGKRSAQTGAHADLFHVIPACMFTPELGDTNGEWNLLHVVLKEYGEELFDHEIDRKALDTTYFYEEWPSVAALREALADGRCVFKITGLVVNLFNLRPEVCALLLVKDPSWWAAQKRKMRTNWEYVERQKMIELIRRGERARTEFRLDHAEEDFLSYFDATPGMWVPPGLAALWLGVEAARRELAIG